jgi:hypothetical protein
VAYDKANSRILEKILDGNNPKRGEFIAFLKNNASIAADIRESASLSSQELISAAWEMKLPGDT